VAARQPALNAQPCSGGGARDSLLDGLRGLAILGVVLIHVVARLPEDQQAVARWLDHAGRFGVPLFLVVAGAMVSRQHVHAAVAPDSFAWLTRRLQVVAIPYVVWALAYALVEAAPLAGGWQPGEPLLTRLVAIVLGYSAEQLWYMPAYLGLLLLMVPLATAARWLRGRFGAGPLRAVLAGLVAAQFGLLLALGQVSAAQSPPPPWAAWLLHNEGRIPLQWLGFVATGWLIDDLGGWRRLAQPPLRPLWLVAGLVLHGWVAMRPAASAQFDDFWCSTAIFWVTVAVLAWAPPLLGAARTAGWPVWLAALGRRSLPIYLAHVAGLLAVERWAPEGWLLHRPLWLAVAVVLSVLVTAVAVRLHPRLFRT
jgi:peptidoglycan/LPS O-acetylase OafA/YrhL